MPYMDEGTGWQKTDTSHAAAAAVTSGAGRLRDLVLGVLAQTPEPVSTETIARLTGHAFSSVQPRVSELRRDGLIKDSGKRGRTAQGRSCILWEAVAHD
ncbi:hypothetical protein [Roseovarius sp. SYSU LYC5161]|uniref:hypothetical protein n=1 Tax=Roseovarius halophilus (ex Wu et al. 2025) TaxID=3376060 RepID=UPI00399C493B